MIIKDHKDNLNRELSLVEQKKMQWAREREEMSKLDQYHSKLSSKYERNTIRTQLITNTEIVHQNNNFHNKNLSMRRIRSPSLPPIDRFDKTITRQGSNNSDQSSGYLSGSGGSSSLPPNSNVIDSQNFFEYNFGQTRLENNQVPQKNHTNNYSINCLHNYPSLSNNERENEFNGQKPLGTPSSESSVTSQDQFSVSSYANSSTIDSTINYQKSREGRAKWGSYLFDSFAKDTNGRSSRSTNGPGWLEKSLSEARDSEEETMSISVQSVSSFLRGQNVPVDPFVLAEREEKRRKAMELQQAIKEQLEEREHIKKIERERQWQQEKIEEERLARELELERKRLEQEQIMQNEKHENERKKEEAMKKALEKAAMEAQLERERKRREKALALQSSLDETISIQKIGERTEIHIEGCQKSISDVSQSNDEIEGENVSIKNGVNSNSVVDNHEEDDDGETILIGTPIKLKKKNLETFKRKFHKRHQNVEENKTSDEEVSTPKTSKSTESLNERKSITDLEGIAIVLQSMPLVPFVPLTNNEMFNFNHLNNLAFLMAAQNRINSPNIMLPILAKDSASPSSEKLDFSQFIIPPTTTNLTLQIQQAESKADIKSVPPTPELEIINQRAAEKIHNEAVKNNDSAQHVSIPPTPEVLKTKIDRAIASTPSIPHDGTFTKENHSQDACTSTSTETRFADEEKEVRVLTPQKYRRSENHVNLNAKTVSTQTESFLFCEYCSYQHHHHHTHPHRCLALHSDENNNNSSNSNVTASPQYQVNARPKEKKIEERPKWNARNPPIKYLKASERDPFYGRNRKKRYLRKAASESEKNDDDTCTFKDCPLVKSPLLSKRSCAQAANSSTNLCSNLMGIKTDRFGRVCIVDEQSFIMKEAYRRVHKSDNSDGESSIDLRHKNFFLPKANDFQDVFVD